MGVFCPKPGSEHDTTMSPPNRLGRVMAGTSAAALVAAITIRGPASVVAASSQTWEPFAAVGAVITAGWVGVRSGVIDKLGRRLVASERSSIVTVAVVLAWVFALAGFTNLDVAVVATAPLALVVASTQGLDASMLALGVAQAANAGSILLPTANLTTMLTMSGSTAIEGSYLRQVWLAWILVGVVTVPVLSALASGADRPPNPAPVHWSLPRIAADLGVMLVLATGLRALIPRGVPLGQDYWSAALRASTLAATANNLPAAAAVHAGTQAATWGAVTGLAIGPNLLLTGSVASVIVRGIARDAGVPLSLRTFTLVGFVLVPLQLAAAFLGLKLTGAL
jgi:Na+/H+ antiporter NhaD/arsenite permease-like protein